MMEAAMFANQTELHRHLDVSVRHSTLLQLAQERGLEGWSTSLESFRDKWVIREPLADLCSVLNRFSLFQKVLDRPEVLERVGFEVIEDCRAEGTRNVELRFSPSFVCELSHLSWNAALDGFEKGVKKGLEAFPEMRAGLICIASRDYGVDEVEKTVDFFLTNQDRFIGLDLAGNEEDFPCRLFQGCFKRAIQCNAKVTIHAGEATGPENIWEAIELLGARRIGHGVSSARDPALVKYLAEKRICLEICPTSNWLTRSVSSLTEHPLPRFIRAGVPVSINTDDPAIFCVTLRQEFEVCLEKMGLSFIELELCNKHAVDSSFLELSS